MRQIFQITWVLSLFISSCDFFQINENQALALQSIQITSNAVLENSFQSNQDETLISVPLQQHILTLHRDKHDVMSVSLSTEHKESVKNWWDSLPRPIRTKVLSNEIDIELVSEVTSTKKELIDPMITDSQVEKTGDFLEQIMGKDADITFVVSTRIVDTHSVYNTSSLTNIRLIESIPVKLDIYTTHFTMRDEQFDNDNARSLQYWWIQLPDDIKEQVKNNSINLVATYHQSNTLDEFQTMESDKVMENLSSMNESLAKIIGIRQVSGAEVPFNFITPPTIPSPMATQSHIELKLIRNTPSIPIL